MISAFAYQSAQSVDEAVGALANEWGKVDLLAGGTDLVNLMKEGLAAPQKVVGIKGIAGLKGVVVKNDQIQIGAATTLAEVAEHSAVAKHLPALAAAAAVIGGPQIRNMGTVGGNLCQRNRDWYFRLGLDTAVKEETQYSAIFPQDGQIYVHPSTLAPPLIAYGATVNIAGAGGAKRSVPVESFFQVSDLKGKRETVLKPNEMVVSVSVPVAGTKSADYEVRERESHDWPLVQAAVALQLDGNTIKKASIVLGHVAPVPLRAKAAEEAAAGKELNEEVAFALAKKAAEGAKPLGKNEYKVTLVQVAVKRALLAAVGNEYWRT